MAPRADIGQHPQEPGSEPVQNQDQCFDFQGDIFYHSEKELSPEMEQPGHKTHSPTHHFFIIGLSIE